MDNNQRTKRDSYTRVQGVETKYAIELADIPEYATEKAEADDIVTAIDKASGKQTVDTSGAVVQKDAAKKKMAETTIKFAQRGFVKIRKGDDAELIAQLDHPESYIFYASDELSIERAKNIEGAIERNLATLTNIRPEDVLAIHDSIAKFEAVRVLPVSEIQGKKAEGTEVLPGLFDKVDELNDAKMLLIESYLKDSHPEIVTAMKLAKAVILTGVRHTSVDIIFKNSDGGVIANGNALDVKMNKNYATNSEGLVHIAQRLSGGHVHFTCSAPGKQTVELDVKIIRGVANSFAVRLANA